MKKLVKYYEVGDKTSSIMFKLIHQEIIATDSLEELKRYIQSKRDRFGHTYVPDKVHGFDYVSRLGAIQIEDYSIKTIRL